MNSLQKYSLRIADNSWILGCRLAEYSSHGPFLEEDLAITNVGLDHVGLAEAIYKYVAELDGEKSADDFAFRRAEQEYFNVQLVEYPNEHFGYIMARQFMFDVYQFYFLEALQNSKDETLAALAVKSLKEVTYHLRRSSQWMYRLGDGTTESHAKIQEALNHLFMYKDELFFMDETDEELIKSGVGVDLNNVKKMWEEKVSEVLTKATLQKPEVPHFSLEYGKNGHHTDYFGYILLDLQYLNNKYPDAVW